MSSLRLSADFQSGVDQLQGFSNSLTRVIGSLGSEFEDLKHSFEASQKQIHEIRDTLSGYNHDLQDQKFNLSETIDTHERVEKSVVTQVYSITGELHEDLMDLRKSMKSELVATQGAISQLIMDSLANFVRGGSRTGGTGGGTSGARTGARGLTRSGTGAVGDIARGGGGRGGGAGGGGGGADGLGPIGEDEEPIGGGIGSMSSAEYQELEEAIAAGGDLPKDAAGILLQRIVSLEARMNAQQAVNATLQQAIHADNQVQDHFDALTGQIALLERQQAQQRKQQAEFEALLQHFNSTITHHEKLIIGLDLKLRGRAGGTSSVTGSISDPVGNDAVMHAMQDELFDVQDHDRRHDAQQRAISAAQSDTSNALKRCAADIASVSLMVDTVHQRLTAVEHQLTDTIAKRMDTTEASVSLVNKSIDEIHATLEHYKGQMDGMLDQMVLLKQASKQGTQTNIGEDIAEAKQMWRHLLADVNIGLENLHVASGDYNGKTDQLVPGLVNFRTQLLATLPAFESLDTPEATLDALYPKLDKLTADAVRLVEMDREARQPVTLGVTFDDFVCADRSYRLAERFNAACDFSSRILDIRLQKVQLKRRLDEVEQRLKEKNDSVDMIELERDLRVLIGTKADLRDVEGILSKKASIAELQQFREMIYSQIDDMRASGLAVPGSVARGKGGDFNDDHKEGVREDLTKRFELLYRQFQDLMDHTVKFVPREEIEAALHTVLTEVKSIKTSYVDAVTFREKLKKKADSTDLEKLLTLLSANLAESERTSSALHAKCLVCDKPVNSLNQQVVGSKSAPSLPGVEGATRPTSPSIPSTGAVTGYEKERDADKEKEKESLRPSTTKKKKGSTNQTGSSHSQGGAHLPPEINVLRNSIDLPPLTEGVSNSVGGGTAFGSVQSKAYKQRIRSAAGGGIGPSYTLDTR